MLFGVWSAALLYLLITGRYTLFLRPGFGLLLALAHFIAMGVHDRRPAGGAAGDRRHRRRACAFSCLLVPILYLVSLPAATLGSRAFTNRFVG